MKVFELFSGIGGLHYAFKRSGFEIEICRALDINTIANQVYSSNFPDTCLLQSNVLSLTADIFNNLKIDIISMSPPCQPFTRVGLQKGSEDTRCSALLHILQLLPQLETVKYIILENVVGFENSATRDDFLRVLQSAGYRYQEFILCPTQFNIPNSRSRYYLLGKRNEIQFCFEEVKGIWRSLPEIEDSQLKLLRDEYNFLVGDILESDAELPVLSDKILMKYAYILDIVFCDATRTCCFTKAYSHYVEGTGSVFCPKSKTELHEVFTSLKNLNKSDPEYLNVLQSLKLRFFSPVEVSRLMCFPEVFNFPSNLTLKQKYRLLGNSANVHVLTLLIRILLS